MNINKMNTWHVDMILNAHKEHVAQAVRDYEITEALNRDRKGSEISSRILSGTGQLLVDLGKRLQRLGGTPSGTRRAGTV